MDSATRDIVRRRAHNRCEYCLLPQLHSALAHHVEHIVARQHGGADEVDNLALACHRCNLCKGPNLTSIDSVSREVVPLFHPRRDAWEAHFRMRGARPTFPDFPWSRSTRRRICRACDVTEPRSPPTRDEQMIGQHRHELGDARLYDVRQDHEFGGRGAVLAFHAQSPFLLPSPSYLSSKDSHCAFLVWL